MTQTSEAKDTKAPSITRSMRSIHLQLANVAPGRRPALRDDQRAELARLTAAAGAALAAGDVSGAVRALAGDRAEG